jgi:hypothetical protein
MSLTDVTYGCTLMTYGPRQRRPEGRTFEPCSRPAPAVRSTSRSRRATRARLFDLSSASLSLSAGSPAIEGAGAGGRIQAGVHREASPQFDSARTVVRICQEALDQRSGKSSLGGSSASRGRSWLRRSGSQLAACNRSIILIAYCLRSWLRRISCWCRSGDGTLEAGQRRTLDPNRMLDRCRKDQTSRRRSLLRRRRAASGR